jgi:hypothetical protein
MPNLEELHRASPPTGTRSLRYGTGSRSVSMSMGCTSTIARASPADRRRKPGGAALAGLAAGVRCPRPSTREHNKSATPSCWRAPVPGGRPTELRLSADHRAPEPGQAAALAWLNHKLFYGVMKRGRLLLGAPHRAWTPMAARRRAAAPASNRRWAADGFQTPCWIGTARTHTPRPLSLEPTITECRRVRDFARATQPVPASGR